MFPACNQHAKTLHSSCYCVVTRRHCRHWQWLHKPADLLAATGATGWCSCWWQCHCCCCCRHLQADVCPASCSQEPKHCSYVLIVFAASLTAVLRNSTVDGQPCTGIQQDPRACRFQGPCYHSLSWQQPADAAVLSGQEAGDAVTQHS
jgi:hypothetical protein